MPYKQEWVEPAIAFKVYIFNRFYLNILHTYKDEMWDKPSTYWYTLDYDHRSDDDDAEFDIREIRDSIVNDLTCEYVDEDRYNSNIEHHNKILETFFKQDWRKYNLSCFQHLED